MDEEKNTAGELLKVIWAKRDEFYKEEKILRGLYLSDSKRNLEDYTIINKIYEQIVVVRKTYDDYIISQNDLLAYRTNRK